MKQSDNNKHPAKSKGARFGQRWHSSDLIKIDRWAEDKGVSRSEAIRQLIELGMLKRRPKK
jgi:hypothetical protein